MVFLFTMRSATNKFTKFKSTIMRNYIATFAFLLSCITCFAQGDVTLFTYIYEDVSVMPMEGAHVTLQSSFGETQVESADMDGTCRFDDIVSGQQYTVIVSMDGFSNMNFSFVAPQDDEDVIMEVEVFLTGKEG